MSAKKPGKKELAEQALAKEKQSARNAAWVLSNSSVNAVTTFSNMHPEADSVELFKLFDQNTKEVLAGSTKKIETMLMAQAHTLDCLFHKMTCRAMHAEYIPNTQIYLDIAMKAQKQCRQTLSALVDIKHPRRATFIKQQNNAINQQINNDPDLENFQEKPANELLTEVKHETVDATGTFKTSRADKNLEAVGKVHRGKEQRRQGY